ncbi:MAG: hypothetical protein Kow0098_16450 [Ignavibacteriaceae bacterium]
MKYSVNKYIFCYCLLLLFNPPDFYPKNYYVDVNNSGASDFNPGSKEYPFKTIQHSVNKALPGDTVFVMPGIYEEAIRIIRSGLKGKPIVFKSFLLHKAIIDGEKIDAAKLIDWHGTPDGGFNKHYIIIEGFEIRNARRWALWVQGDNNILRNLLVHSTGHTAIQLITGSHNLFSGNEIHSTGWNGISWEADNGGSGIRTDSNIVEFNFIHDLKYHVAINGFPFRNSEDSFRFGGRGNIIRNNRIENCLEGMYFRFEKDFIIAGNFICNIQKDGIFFHYDESDESAYETTGLIFNNTFSSIHYNSINNANIRGIRIFNNIFTGSSPKDHKYYIYLNKRTESDLNEIYSNLFIISSATDRIAYIYDKKMTISEVNNLFADNYYDQSFILDKAKCLYKFSETENILDRGSEIESEYLQFDISGQKRISGDVIDLGCYETNAPR